MTQSNYMTQLDRDRGTELDGGGEPDIPLEEAFAVVGWTTATSSITAPPATAADAATRSPDPEAMATTFPGGGAAIARTGTAGAPPATRAGAARQHAAAFS